VCPPVKGSIYPTRPFFLLLIVILSLLSLLVPLYPPQSPINHCSGGRWLFRHPICGYFPWGRAAVSVGSTGYVEAGGTLTATGWVGDVID